MYRPLTRSVHGGGKKSHPQLPCAKGERWTPCERPATRKATNPGQRRARAAPVHHMLAPSIQTHRWTTVRCSSCLWGVPRKTCMRCPSKLTCIRALLRQVMSRIDSLIHQAQKRGSVDEPVISVTF